jgi:hypothetical protein
VADGGLGQPHFDSNRAHVAPLQQHFKHDQQRQVEATNMNIID